MKTLIFALLFTLPAQADWTKIKSTDYPIAPPPSEGSSQYKRDFEDLHRYQDRRKKSDCEMSKRQMHPTFKELFGEDLTILTDAEKAQAEPVVEKIMKLSEQVAEYHKGKFKRPRPYDTDPSLEPCVKKPGGEKSYPSSHAANSSAGACVLALMYPQKSRQLIQYGDQLGELRVIVGVHHPSDVVAGRLIGKEVCRRAQLEPDFKAELRR